MSVFRTWHGDDETDKSRGMHRNRDSQWREKQRRGT